MDYVRALNARDRTETARQTELAHCRCVCVCAVCVCMRMQIRCNVLQAVPAGWHAATARTRTPTVT